MTGLRRAALMAIKAVSAVSDPLAGGHRSGPRILIYHQVGANSGLEMDVTESAFVRQIDWILSEGRVVGLSEAVESPDDDSYVLTFDDGHLSVFERAFPILAERGIPFTLYLSSGALESGQLLHGDPRMPVMTWGQITEMVETGLVTVGSHSHDHLDMRHHTEEVIASDLQRCDELIGQRLEVEPEHFAYPWGHWSAAADTIVRDRYSSATVGSGPGIETDSDRFKLSRIPVMLSDGPFFFRRKMYGGFRLETKLRGVRDGLRR